jgi:hypothetical protein
MIGSSDCIVGQRSTEPLGDFPSEKHAALEDSARRATSSHAHPTSGLGGDGSRARAGRRSPAMSALPLRRFVVAAWRRSRSRAPWCRCGWCPTEARPPSASCPGVRACWTSCIVYPRSLRIFEREHDRICRIVNTPVPPFCDIVRISRSIVLLYIYIYGSVPEPGSGCDIPF